MSSQSSAKADDLFGMLMGMDAHSHDKEKREDYVRAPFGYPGSKAKAISNILPHLPYTNMYVDVFGGSGAIWLARHPSKVEIYNDRCSGVTCFFRVCRNPNTLRALVDRLSVLIHSREEFIWSASTWRDCEEEVERAARWYYSVKCSFGSQGLYFGRTKSTKATFANKLHSNLDLFYPLHDRIKNTQIENLDWQTCLLDYNDPEAVWYLDPPYYRSSTGMYHHELSDAEHRELLERVQTLKGFVALSGYPNELYDSYEWDKRVVWEQNTTTLGMAFTGSNKLGEYKEILTRKTAMECLWIRYAR
jgi:DNA adenine methylase